MTAYRNCFFKRFLAVEEPLKTFCADLSHAPIIPILHYTLRQSVFNAVRGKNKITSCRIAFSS